jgi:hypothetical protein
MIFYKKKIFI